MNFPDPSVIYYDKVKNFGDAINSRYWKCAFGFIENLERRPSILGIGTILNDVHLAQISEYGIVIAGSGAGYGSISQMPTSVSIGFVRGPLTCDKLNLPREYGVGDPIYISKEVLGLDTSNKSQQAFKVSFIPHFESLYYYQWRAICKLCEISLISPLDSFENVFSGIVDSSLVITESLHGAIIADSMRIPYIPVKTRPEINDFKWQDFFLSLNIKSQLTPLCPPAPGRSGILNIPSMSQSIKSLQKIASQKPILSSFAENKNMKDRLFSSITSLHASYLLNDFSKYLTVNQLSS